MSAPECERERTARRWRMRDGQLVYVGRVPVPAPRAEGAPVDCERETVGASGGEGES
jgi:hypothetical protein